MFVVNAFNSHINSQDAYAVNNTRKRCYVYFPFKPYIHMYTLAGLEPGSSVSDVRSTAPRRRQGNCLVIKVQTRRVVCSPGK
jgi:hypothetical protein